MKFIKRHLCDLPCCYAVSPLQTTNGLKYLLATDDEGPCYCIDAETFSVEKVWDGPGGTMSIVPFPDGSDAFLASQNFLPGFHARHSRIVMAQRENSVWRVTPWLDLPYVHRFDILQRDGRYYLLCCILTTTDQEQADWNFSGKLMAAQLTADFKVPVRFSDIAKKMTKNHGYCRVNRNGYSMAYTACDEGVFEVIPPKSENLDWTVHKVLDAHASDVAVCDIDNDGQDEIATIEPFHGTDFVVYHRNGNSYSEIYRYPEKMDFVHVIWGGVLNGRNVFLGGCRKMGKELFLLYWEQNGFHIQKIEEGRGPSNVAVISHKNGDRILVANRESGEGAVFQVC